MKTQKLLVPIDQHAAKNEVERQKAAVLAKHPNATSHCGADYYTHDEEWVINIIEDVPGVGRLVRTLTGVKNSEDEAWAAAYHALEQPFGPLSVETVPAYYLPDFPNPEFMSQRPTLDQMGIDHVC